MGHKGFVTRYLQEISLCIEMTGRTGDIYGEKDIQNGYVSPFI